MTADGNEAAATLKEIDEVTRQTRAVVHPTWFPMVLFGAFGLASTPFCSIGGGLGVGLFWVVAGPVGGVLTARYYRRRALATGAGMRGGAYWAVAAGIFVAAWLAGASGSSRLETAGPMVAVALGYLLFARLERSRITAICSAVLGLLAVAVGIADPDHGCVVLSLAFGGVFTVTGLILRPHERG
jgi:hypothetical protein